MIYCELCKAASIYVMKFKPCTHIVCSDCFIKSIWRNRGDALNCLRSNPVLCWVCRATCAEVSVITWRGDIGNAAPDSPAVTSSSDDEGEGNNSGHEPVDEDISSAIPEVGAGDVSSTNNE